MCSHSYQQTMTNNDDDRSLLVLVLDLNPIIWGEREREMLKCQEKEAKQKLQQQTNPKKKVKPILRCTNINETIEAVLGFCVAHASLHRENALAVVGVTGSSCAVLYPRKKALDDMISQPVELMGCRIDVRLLTDSIKLGISDLMESSLRKTESNGEGTNTNHRCSLMSAGLSLALCIVHRFNVAFGRSAGIFNDVVSGILSHSDVFAMMEGKNGKHGTESKSGSTGSLSPRIMIIQASDDNTRDYNAFMNCVFAAIKEGITIDGCFIPSGMDGHATSSVFLEQVCDRTNGAFLAPGRGAQMGGKLLQILLTLFLSPISTRGHLNLLSPNKVDFRAKCFITGESVDIAYVCNQCLSIFKEPPNIQCPTCEAHVRTNITTNGEKRKLENQ